MPRLSRKAPVKKKRATMKLEMEKFKEGQLRSGSKKGSVVTNPRQAIAIGLSVSGQSRKKSNKKRK